MKSLRLVLWVCVLIAGVSLISLATFKTAPVEESTTPAITPIAGFNQGTHFTLTDETGITYHTADALADGQYALVFFGFTFCPAICPTELQKIAAVLDTLPEEQADRVQPLFVTIDPERDTPAVLKEYVAMFHPKIKGLTGTPQDVKTILNEWHVYAARAEDPSMNEYTMDHSTYTYLVDNKMNILAIFRLQDTPDDMVRRITEITTQPMSAS